MVVAVAVGVMIDGMSVQTAILSEPLYEISVIDPLLA
jgi:hypothetical protein